MQSKNGQISWSPVHILGEERTSRWLVICDHATNRIPDSVAGGHLGITDEDMARHIPTKRRNLNVGTVSMLSAAKHNFNKNIDGRTDGSFLQIQETWHAMSLLNDEI